MKIRGELAIGVALIARHNLVFGRSFEDRTMMQACASSAKLRVAGPIFTAALEAMGFTSGLRHLGLSAAPGMGLPNRLCYRCSPSMLSFMTLDVTRRPAEHRPA